MKLKIKKLAEWDRIKFGDFQDMISPNGECFADTHFSFYRDLITMPGTPSGKNASFSKSAVGKRPMVVDTVEYNREAYEMLLPLDGDILIHVIPASQSDALPLDKMEVFLIPKHTLIVLKSGVWHHAPFAYNTKKSESFGGLA